MSPNGSNAQQASPRRRTILIIDDEPWYVEPLRDALENEGYNILQASDAGAAYELTKSQRGIDLIIMDVMMPPGGEIAGDYEGFTRTGVGLCEKIRKESGLAPEALPIICLTVVQDDTVKARMQSLGVVFLSKATTSIRTLIEEANCLLARKAGR
jgi:CheY-like chemotaxis protein